MEKPTVSIIVPFYNAEEFMEDCLRDIRGQTYRNLDILFVNDGSTDRGAELVASCQREDSRIRLLNQKKETTGAARNRGLEAAKGEYVLFLDADDRFDPEMVEKMTAAIQERDADIVICNSRGLNHNTRMEHSLAGGLNCSLLPNQPVFSWRDIPESIFQLTAGWAWDKLYRTAFLREKGIRFPNIPVSEDLLFVDAAFMDAERICAIKDILVTHRTNRRTSMEGSRGRWWRCVYDVLLLVWEELLRRGIFHALERSFINRAASELIFHICFFPEGEYFSEAFDYFSQAFEPLFHFCSYEREYYYDKEALDILTKMRDCTAIQFLCERNLANRELMQAVQSMEAHIRSMEAHIRWLEAHKKWKFPAHSLPSGSQVLVYGYGDVGRDFCRDIQNDISLNLVAVADRNWESLPAAPCPVIPPQAIADMDYDALVIALINRETAESIRKFLIAQGVPSEKILWFDEQALADG